MSSPSRARRRLVLGGFVLAVLVLLAGCSYNPPDVCGSCSLGGAAYDEDVNVSVLHSQLWIDVERDGSARVKSRIRVAGPDLERLQSNETLRTELVRDSIAQDGIVSPNEISGLSTTFDNKVLVVRYTVPEFVTTSPGNVLVVDAFHRQSAGSTINWEVRANEVTVMVPEGYHVSNVPPNGRAYVRSIRYDSWVDHRTYIAMAPDDAALAGWWTQLALALTVGGWLVPKTLMGGLVPAFVLGTIALSLLSWSGDQPPESNLSRRTLRSSTAVAVVGTLLAVLFAASPDATNSGFVVLPLFVFAPLLSFVALARVADGSPSMQFAVTTILVGSALLVSEIVVIATGQAGMVLTGIWTGLVVVVCVPLYLLVRKVT